MGNHCRFVSSLQAKGFLTLALVLIAESITVSNAVKLWANYQYQGGYSNRDYAVIDRHTPFSRATREIQECLGSDAESCPSTSPAIAYASPVVKRTTLGRLSRRAVLDGTRDCCTDCSHCVVSGSLDKCTSIPRGGDAEQIVGATAEATKAVTPYGIPLNGWKVIFQAFLTTLNVLCWLIPLRSKKISENKLALSLANAFSGGVFLSLAFGHLIPECVHGFEGYNEVTPYVLVLSGYLLIFFVEKVAFDAHEILHEMEHSKDKKAANGDGENQAATSGRSALILLGALAVHSILEMAALGLSDSFGDSAILTLSIALHQVSSTFPASRRCIYISANTIPNFSLRNPLLFWWHF
jgi:hypothetical protein